MESQLALVGEAAAAAATRAESLVGGGGGGGGVRATDRSIDDRQLRQDAGAVVALADAVKCVRLAFGRCCVLLTIAVVSIRLFRFEFVAVANATRAKLSQFCARRRALVAIVLLRGAGGACVDQAC